MKHRVSGMFICEVEGDTRKEVMIETARAVQEGRAKLHIMEVQDDEERTNRRGLSEV